MVSAIDFCIDVNWILMIRNIMNNIIIHNIFRLLIHRTPFYPIHPSILII